MGGSPQRPQDWTNWHRGSLAEGAGPHYPQQLRGTPQPAPCQRWVQLQHQQTVFINKHFRWMSLGGGFPLVVVYEHKLALRNSSTSLPTQARACTGGSAEHPGGALPRVTPLTSILRDPTPQAMCPLQT